LKKHKHRAIIEDNEFGFNEEENDMAMDCVNDNDNDNENENLQKKRRSKNRSKNNFADEGELENGKKFIF